MKASIFKKTILYFLRQYFRLVSCVEVERNDTEIMEPPYLILPNHSTNWDPFLVNAYIRYPINYVTSREFFKKPIIKYLLKYAEAIPKVKFMKDTSTIKEIIRRKRENKIIGIFPEGRRNWDGKTENIIYSTAKLIKLLSIPVVLVSLKGAYLSQPRWAFNNRKGKIAISYTKILDSKNISTMSVDEIYKYTNKKFEYDEYTFQEEVMNTYKGKKLAERLELFLFICPHCLSMGNMKSSKDLFFCQDCGYTVKYNVFGFFEKTTTPTKGEFPVYFENPKSWNEWQLSHLKEYIKSSQIEDELFFDNGAQVYIERKGKFRKLGTGSIHLTNKNFIFKDVHQKAIIFGFSRIKGLNIHYNHLFEFYYDDILYRFEFSSPGISAYKWLKGIELSRNIT